ncbi:hypothetical protein [Mucilaginibacter ginsenosidivorans]|uniref:Uncharacterized protein n=1 Tax=Mucilaginibacter ginsenosidivorans TaxID=398053 RepID=A0A5B8V025_9SPHI|nr:hypothetical protein [Mucilaginibacter ginsenosidivorans]QEC64538.1 hypothetical protein FRZ54_18830 [Mucilaginibacter ginsenosidivorans]
MEEQFEAFLTGSDNLVDGIVTPIHYAQYGRAYEFKSIDGTLHLVISRDKRGKWVRVDGTEPYFSGWVDELAEQVAKAKQL